MREMRFQAPPDETERSWLQRARLTLPGLSWHPKGCDECTGTGYKGRIGYSICGEASRAVLSHMPPPTVWLFMACKKSSRAGPHWPNFVVCPSPFPKFPMIEPNLPLPSEKDDSRNDQPFVSPLERLLRPFAEFSHLSAASGIVLVVFALSAILWANSPWSASYAATWEVPFTVGFGENFLLSKPLIHWINDGLMAVFFLLVGLEIKREITTGELATWRIAALPCAAALGGMVLPAGIYAALNAGHPTFTGWGIPMATDIAFSLGILALMGSRVPLVLKIFLTALAIADDLGAVLVIAIFYTSETSVALLLAAVAVTLMIWLFGRIGGRSPVVFTILGLVLWLCVLKSGVHATVAGVMMAFALPSKKLPDEGDPLTEVWEHSLHPWVAFLIMPVFALANAGVTLSGDLRAALSSAASVGIIGGLVLGKPLGILLFCWLAVKCRIASLPDGITWRHVAGVGALAGIGFTMSLFIADLAFENEAHLTSAKAGILAASLISAIVGSLALACVCRRPSAGN